MLHLGRSSGPFTFATFGDDQLRGLGVVRGRISGFPIDLRRCHYNTLALQCECVTLDEFLYNIYGFLTLFHIIVTIYVVFCF